MEIIPSLFFVGLPDHRLWTFLYGHDNLVRLETEVVVEIMSPKSPGTDDEQLPGRHLAPPLAGRV